MNFVGYFKFILGNRALVGFGFAIAFASSYGQTFFIGVFGPSVQAEFGLSHTHWGMVYLVGTLASAVVLPWSGKLIDRLDLRIYTAGIFALFVVACLVMSMATGAVTLALAIFLLRQSGQGLMSHVSLTTMARYFEEGRGRAIAIASLGFSVGEAILPVIAVAAITYIGWRHSYQAAGISLVIILGPLCLWALRGHGERHARLLERLSGSPGDQLALAGRSWTRPQVLRDSRFYLLIPALLTPSIVITAMFFHHLNLADAKGWSHAWITGNYVMFAIASLLTALVCGPLIDRLGAVRIVRIMLFPMIAGMVVVSMADNPWIAAPYLFLLGVNTGISHTVVSAVWAELYGVVHLGAIKSMAASLSVFGSALGPVIMGYMLDIGVPTDRVCLIFALAGVINSVLLFVALSGPPRPPPR